VNFCLLLGTLHTCFTYCTDVHISLDDRPVAVPACGLLQN